MLKNNEDEKKRRKKYYEKLLNKEYPRETIECMLWNEVLTGLVGEEKVKRIVMALKKQKGGRIRWSTNKSV